MVRGDSELIIKQIKGEYAAKHPHALEPTGMLFLML
jgi:hypothetical protein